MLSLAFTTVLMAFLDSFNPVALTQQLVLLGLLKKPKKILFFSIAVGVTNMLFGLLVYYGLAAIISEIWREFGARYGWILTGGKVLLGILALLYMVYSHLGRKINALREEISVSKAEQATKSQDNPAKRKTLTPMGLILLGAFAAICEVPTSMPYFAFIAVLLSVQPPILAVLLLLVLYNAIFTLPLHIIFALYVKCYNKVDKVYRFLMDSLFYYGGLAFPYLIGVGGAGMVLLGLYQIIML